VFQQILNNVTQEEFRVHFDEETLMSLFKYLVANCFDLEVEDRENLVPKVFAKMFDTRIFRLLDFEKWLQKCFFRKDCPSAFLLFISLKIEQLQSEFRYASRHDLGLLLAYTFLENEDLRKIYQWKTYPETRKVLWRKQAGAQVYIEKAEQGQKDLGQENVDWKKTARNHSLKLDGCMVCGKEQVKLSRCGGCKQRFYCGRSCQAKDWTQNQHKTICPTVADLK
jgi:hypothetical protein